jgi:hypothetical protein
VYIYIRKNANVVGKDENLEKKRIYEFKLNLFPPMESVFELKNKFEIYFMFMGTIHS